MLPNFRPICVVVLISCCSAACAQYMAPSRPAAVEPQLRAEASLTGRLAEGGLPPDKRYAELTQEQKDKVRGQYQSMAADDEPPFPVDGLASLYRPIAQAQQSLRLEGRLEMEVEVDAAGKARSVGVRKSPSSKITQVAAAALMFQTYKPAVCGGQPCAMVFPLQVDLILR